jgi:ABC-type Na+ efflux pump permease subunit
VAGKDGLLVQILTWVPLWTPFAVLARLGMGIEWWEMIGSGILLAGFVALEVIFLGRLFRASLLATGQKPGFKQLMERFKAPA